MQAETFECGTGGYQSYGGGGAGQSYGGGANPGYGGGAAQSYGGGANQGYSDSYAAGGAPKQEISPYSRQPGGQAGNFGGQGVSSADYG